MFSQIITALASDGPSKQAMDFNFVTAVVITGLLVVFVILILLVIFVSLFGLAFKKKSSDKNGKNDIQPIIVQPVVEEGISDEVIAVITAAIAAMTASSGGKTFSIRSIRQASPQRPAWAAAGIRENTSPF